MIHDVNQLARIRAKLKMLKAAYKPIDNKVYEITEERLHIRLPEEFKTLGRIAAYEYIHAFDFFSILGYDQKHYGVIAVTAGYRENCSFPHNYLVLYEDDAGAVVMKIPDDPKDKAQVIWCALEDLYNIIDGSPLQYKPIIFESFADFYEYLLDEQLKEEAGEGD